MSSDIRDMYARFREQSAEFTPETRRNVRLAYGTLHALYAVHVFVAHFVPPLLPKSSPYIYRKENELRERMEQLMPSAKATKEPQLVETIH